MLAAQILAIDRVGSYSVSVTCELCGLGQITNPSGTQISPPKDGGNNSA